MTTKRSGIPCLAVSEFTSSGHVLSYRGKIMTQSWEVSDSGFWKETPYIALANGYHYPEAKVFANHHIVIGEDNNVETYIFWNHYYERNDLVPILEKCGFTSIANHKDILQDTGECWNGENVTFYTAVK